MASPTALKQTAFSITSHHANSQIRRFATKIKDKIPLDFPALSRLAVVMDESKMDEVRRHFADITGCLEDASLIAVEGQSTELETRPTLQIIHALRQSLQEVEVQLARIEELTKSV